MWERGKVLAGVGGTYDFALLWCGKLFCFCLVEEGEEVRMLQGAWLAVGGVGTYLRHDN